jgi:hypothetical protein
MRRLRLLLLVLPLGLLQACTPLQAAAKRAEADPAAYRALDLNAHYYVNDPQAKLGQQEMERIIGN